MDIDKNHVKEEEDLPFLDELNDLGKDEIFSEFMRQNPVDLSELEQYTHDEMSQILAQEMDDSVVVHVPPTLSMPTTMELPSDIKKTRERQSRSVLNEFAVLNPRRSRRIMMKRASGIKSENMKRIEEYIAEEKANFLQATSQAQAAQLAGLKIPQRRSYRNTALKELRQASANQIHLQDARNEDTMSGMEWKKMMASDPTMASVPFPFIAGNSAELLPNLRGQENSAEVFLGFAGASSSAAGGAGTLSWCTNDDSSGNIGLAEGSGKSTDLAPTD